MTSSGSPNPYSNCQFCLNNALFVPLSDFPRMKASDLGTKDGDGLDLKGDDLA